MTEQQTPAPTEQQTPAPTEQQTPAPTARGVPSGAWAAARRLGLLGAVLVAALAPATVALGTPQPAPLVLGLALIGWAPGHCVAVVARIWDPLLFAMVTIAVSLCLCVVVASSLFYLGIWNALTTMLVTGTATVAIAAFAWKEARAR